MLRKIGRLTALAALAAALSTGQASAAEKVKVAIGQLGLWDTLPTVFAKENGYFKDAGLDVEYHKTRGGAETVQLVVLGEMNFGLTTGILGAISAYAKGGPLRIVSSEMIGVPDLYWYVRADSKLKTVKDINGAKIGYSRPGSGTNLTLLTLASMMHLTPELVSTGGIAGSRTQLMSHQIDAAWSVPPFGLDLVQAGKARILFKGDIVTPLASLTVRVNTANAAWLAKNRDTARKFMQAYDKAADWMFGAGKAEATKRFAKMNKLPLKRAEAAVDFYKRENLGLRVKGLDRSIELAQEYKRISKPLTAAQKAELVDLVYDPGK